MCLNPLPTPQCFEHQTSWAPRLLTGNGVGCSQSPFPLAMGDACPYADGGYDQCGTTAGGAAGCTRRGTRQVTPVYVRASCTCPVPPSTPPPTPPPSPPPPGPPPTPPTPPTHPTPASPGGQYATSNVTIVETFLTGTTDLDAGVVTNRVASYRASIQRYLGVELSALATINVVIGTESTVSTARRRRLIAAADACTGDVTPLSATISFSEPVATVAVVQIAEERPSVATSGAVELQQCGDAVVAYNEIVLADAPPPPPASTAGEIVWGFAWALVATLVIVVLCMVAYAIAVGRDGIAAQYKLKAYKEGGSQRMRERGFRESGLLAEALGARRGWTNLQVPPL